MQNFKTLVLYRYSNPNPVASNEKEFGQTAFNSIKLLHDKKNIHNKDNENSFYALFNQMVNKTDVTDPAYNVINLDNNDNRQAGIFSFQQVLSSFAKTGNKPILQVSNRLKESVENIQNTALLQQVEQ